MWGNERTMKSLVKRFAFWAAGSSAILYIGAVAVTLAEGEKAPWWPNDWLWVVVGIFIVGGSLGLILELVSRRVPDNSGSAPTTDPDSVAHPRTAAPRASGVRIGGPVEVHGRVMLSRQIGGRWLYVVKWRTNGLTIGYLAAGPQGGFDAFGASEEHLSWAPTKRDAAKIVEDAAE